MPGKQKLPPPIDRPLSKAYLRAFTGWSTAYPPGTSEPTSCRIMENVFVDRNGGMSVRPGLRFLSYAESPDRNPSAVWEPGLAPTIGPKATFASMVGSQEPFYLKDGTKALLFAVREFNGTVGFRAIRFADGETVVHRLGDVKIGFSFPQGEAALNFTAATTHVEYLQINNRIVALSDAGESMRMFFVGGDKVAKRLSAITVPEWEAGQKLVVVHPDNGWIDKQVYTHHRNNLPNPSFQLGSAHWSIAGGQVQSVASSSVGGLALRVTSAPTRTNLQTSPLHNVSRDGTAGWLPHKDWGNPRLSVDGDWMKVTDSKGKGLFLAYGARLTEGVRAGELYQIAFDYSAGSNVEVRAYLTFYNASGAKIGESVRRTPKSSRYASIGILAPVGTTSMRVSLGGYNEGSSSTFVKFKNVMLCHESEVTTFFSGDSGANYHWTGTPNASPSVYHPPQNVVVTSARGGITPSAGNCVSIYTSGSAKPYTLKMRAYNKDGVFQNEYVASGSVAGGWTLAQVGANVGAASVSGELVLTLTGLARGEYVDLDAATLEPGVSASQGYFDGATAPHDRNTYTWEGAPHESASIRTTYNDPTAIPGAETPAANTLVSSTADSNKYKMAFFYCFENEVGESTHSQMTEVRIMRPWSNWKWETPSASGEPSGTATNTADRCADQLVCIVPQAVYNRAVQEGAIKWTLYGIAWSDQEPVPPIATVVGERMLYSDPTAANGIASALAYAQGGWIAVTPQRKAGFVEAMLPTEDNRINFSVPPSSRNGLVAGDRIILVGDPADLATIRWSSNRPGEYTNFTSTKGGGAKTLTTGNLNIPAAVTLWQNPQSVDTLAILCMGSDGQSTSFYMTPATVNAQSGTTSVMGFEETTSTPGSMAPYASEVLNNSLFRPIDRALLKSNAANYNINHKTMTDKISNMWSGLLSKEWVMSAQLDNRLYYIVHNPRGELREPGCKGNEIWVLDVSAENGTWSRHLIQACDLRPFNVGPRTYMGVTRPEGLYYLDPDARLDDYVAENGTVLQRPIPWKFETNTQGANRAHDAWAHLQQVSVTAGNFKGSMRYGIRGVDLNGYMVDMSKVFTDDHPVPEDALLWDVEDHLLIRRDMKEWFFYAESVPDVEGSGRVNYVQYRYTPVSVNVGYEYGSVETFEYGSNPQGYSENGIPIPFTDFSRP